MKPVWAEVVSAEDWARFPFACESTVRRNAKREGCKVYEVVVNGRVVKRGKI